MKLPPLPFVCVSLLCLLSTGCITPPTPSDILMVNSSPMGASVSFPDGTKCETPCPVIVSENMQMTIAKAGYKAVRKNLAPGINGTMMIPLELVAPTTNVEESALPDL